MAPLLDLQQTLLPLIQSFGLDRAAPAILASALPAVRLDLTPLPKTAQIQPGVSKAGVSKAGASKTGGDPDLPLGLPWPAWNATPLSFLAQFDCAAAALHDLTSSLPADGTLSFFYDLVDQPWGYDPADLGRARVLYFPAGEPLQRRAAPSPAPRLPETAAAFQAYLTLPVLESRAYNLFLQGAALSPDEVDRYDELSCDYMRAFCPSRPGVLHQLLGHARNIQGDMQLEAELVSAGLDCGDSSGYRHPRRAELEANAAEWQLLFQLDSDDRAGCMWGDAGMLYFWVRRADLAACRFDRTWTGLQCT